MFKGVYTALVTPFSEDGTVDESCLRDLVEMQIEAGVAGIVPCGTTGESPTLDHKEHGEVIEIVVDQVKGRCEVMAGTGSNSTAEAIRMTKHAKELGATSSLQILPYYNRPSQKGVYEHFKAIAEAVDLPIVIYNHPGRTGVSLEVATLVELAKIKNIVGIKEAAGSVAQMMEIIKEVPADFSVISGDDNLCLPLMAAGGHGVISVASNIIPAKMIEFINQGLNNDIVAMRKSYYEGLADLFDGLAIETNPVPVKKMMALKGLVKPVFRSPLCEPEENSTNVLKNLINDLKI